MSRQPESRIPFEFYKFSPSGNATVFLVGDPEAEAASFCAEALAQEGVGGEQAGMVDPLSGRLRMAGGEFCVNACRALGALLAMLNPGENRFTARVSGLRTPVRLKAEGQAPFWRVEARFSMPGLQVGENRVDLPGISHLYANVECFPEAGAAVASAEAALQGDGLFQNPAFGHVWWREMGEELEILPFVKVPAAGTAFLESACGSASLGLAAMLGLKGCRVRQPSGGVLEIRRQGDEFSVAGDVLLICMGRIWLGG